jgi:hypothetical protein
MDKMSKVDVFVIEHTRFYGPEGRREKEVEISGAFTDECEAKLWLREHLEDVFGWNLLGFRVGPSIDGNDVFVYEQVKNGDHHRYQIKKGELFVEGG